MVYLYCLFNEEQNKSYLIGNKRKLVVDEN